jgi:K+-sensing histidine kinase KdpD
MKTDDEEQDKGGLFETPDDPIKNPPKPVMQFIGDWVVLAFILTLLGYIDYATGFEINLTLFYFIPVIIGTKRLGLLAGILLSVVSATIWSVADHYAGQIYSNQLIAVWNTVTRLAAFLTVAWLTAHYVLLLARDRAHATKHRKLAAEVKVLEGLLPICTFCKKIRNDQGGWEPVEHYIEDHTAAKFSHGMCPECIKKWTADAGLGDKPQ